MAKKDIRIIDLFCGIGGLSHGFYKEKMKVVAGFDIDETCRYPFEENNDAVFISKDVREVTQNEINELFGNADIRILVGCAPCQPFSTYSYKSPDKAKKAETAKWSLLNKFAQLIDAVKPEIVSMENVPGVYKFDKSNVFKNFLNCLTDNKYHFDYKIVNCPDYGIPQRRKRLVLLASRLGKISLIQETHSPKTYLSVRDTIGHLEPLSSGQTSLLDPIHKANKLSEINLRRIKQSKPGGTWKDWDEDLLLECHKKNSGKSYRSVYGRMTWDDPAPTMTTFCTGLGNGRFGHPSQDRGITLREAALFQTFPQDYKFLPEGQELRAKILSTHIGNAVPVRLGQVIAQSIKFHLGMND